MVELLHALAILELDWTCLKSTNPKTLIQKQYYRLLKQFHPDVCVIQGIDPEFQTRRIIEAYEKALSLLETLILPQAISVDTKIAHPFSNQVSGYALVAVRKLAMIILNFTKAISNPPRKHRYNLQYPQLIREVFRREIVNLHGWVSKHESNGRLAYYGNEIVAVVEDFVKFTSGNDIIGEFQSSRSRIAYTSYHLTMSKFQRYLVTCATLIHKRMTDSSLVDSANLRLGVIRTRLRSIVHSEPTDSPVRLHASDRLIMVDHWQGLMESLATHIK